MRMRLAAATFLAIGAGTAAVGALDLLGSDTMGPLTNGVLLNCPAATGLVYLGSGSGNGETGMKNGTQAVAPMSRFVQAPAICTGTGTAPGSSLGLAVALDGVAIAANTTNSNACGGVAFTAARSIPVTDRNTTAGVQCPGCDASNNYVTADHLDLLKLAFFGIHHDAGATRDCDSDARRSLVSNYANLFEGACASGTCAGKAIHHLWRRDDASGTTDTFVTLLAPPGIYKIAPTLPATTTTQQSNPFCNAGAVVGTTTNFRVITGFGDYLDNDPIRVPCDGTGSGAGEQVCGTATDGHLGSLGLVQTIFPPDSKDVPVADLYATTLCTNGEVELLPSTKTTFPGPCPAGNPAFGGKCFTSVIRPTPTTFTANCIQATGTGRCPFLTPAGTDCRGANMWMRKPNGDLVRDTSLTAAGRLVTGAAFRIHATRAQVTTSTPCTLATATEQIGCLVGNADACSMGFAGRGAIDPPGTATGLTVKAILPDPTSIQKLITDPANKYPLARKLYLTTLKGFAAASASELELAKCYADDSKMTGTVDGTHPVGTGLIAANGFVPLPPAAAPRVSTTRTICEDFKEENPTTGGSPNGCGLAATNACLANAGIGLPVD